MQINHEKRIGNVLFIVEGSQYEFSLLRRIFCNILNYSYIERRRNALHHFIRETDRYSKIAVINTKESNISDITKNQDYLDSVFNYLIEKCDFPVDDCAIYYLFDRDPESNKDSELILKYIRELKNPYENENLKAGQLLLSYPSIESYTISCFLENVFKLNDIFPDEQKIHLGHELKTFINCHKGIQMNKLNETAILHATNEFMNYLKTAGLDLDIDNFSNASEQIFKQQNSNFADKGYFSFFSMLTLAFIQLGIIEF